MPEVDFVAIGRWLASPEFLKNAVIFIGVVIVLRVLGKALGSEREGVGRGIAATVGKAFSTNWQLTLLASTAFVLSLASGWTTWDGMRNFTGEPILSLMITFGIQGVMLIIAWLIGESFAAGLIAGRRKGAAGVSFNIAGMVAGLLFFAGLGVIALVKLGMIEPDKPWIGLAHSGRLTSIVLLAALTVMIVAPLLVRSRSAILDDYVNGVRVIARNAVLWVMFLACMATSVFFSFDSLFSSIFPQSERKRAAEIRAINQVAGIVSDIGARAVQRRSAEAEALFRSPVWQAYERELDKAGRLAAQAPDKIREEMVRELRERESRVARLEEQRANAQSGQAGLAQRKTLLSEELSRLTGERPAAATAAQEQQTVVTGVEKRADEARAKTLAEEKGVEGSLKVGRGQFWRAARAEEEKIRAELQVARERQKSTDARLAGIDKRIAAIKAELAQIDGDLAKLKGEAETVTQMITVARDAPAGTAEKHVDPMSTVATLERERQAFRQKPDEATLTALRSQCATLQSISLKVPALKNDAAAIDCDPKSAAEAAQRVFALNTGIVTFEQGCVGGDKLPQTGGTDALLSFGRKCLQDSGLVSKDAADLGARLASIDLSRDDKAHRFVVTWNAFNDGNRLAYLALAIAIAIDSLVFMSGLFGANAIRSPLTDLEGRSEMTAEQLEAAIDATLRTTPDPAGTLKALLHAQHPIHDDGSGFTSEVHLDPRDLHMEDMRSVLVAGATIGAVRPVVGDRSRYHLKTGLARYLALAQKKTWPTRRKEADQKALVHVIGYALAPHPQHAAEIVLAELHPISDLEGYAAEVNVPRIEDPVRQRIVRSVVGAGATVAGAIQRDTAENGRYFVSSEAYRTLLMIRAGAIAAFRDDAPAHAALPPAAPVWSGTLTPDVPRIADQSERARPAQIPAAPQAGPPPIPSLTSLHGSLGDGLRDELINNAGLPVWMREEVAGARAMADSEAPDKIVEMLKERAPALGHRLEATQREDSEHLARAYEDLRAKYAHDASAVEVLETVGSELEQLMPILAFSRNGRYEQLLGEFVREHEEEDGAGRLSDAQQAFLARVRHQARALHAMPAPIEPRVARVLEMVSAMDGGGSGGVRVARDDPGKRTLN